MEIIERNRLFPDGRIRKLGRAYENEGLMLDLTLSGFSTIIEGESLTGRADAFGGEFYFAVFADGKELPRVALSGAGEREVVFASGLSCGLHTITVYKMTEQNLGGVRICSLAAPAFIAAPEEKSEFITFYGDSITCGYGTEGISPDPFRPDTENPVKGYAYILARFRNSDMDVVSYSGVSVSEQIWVREFTLPDFAFSYSVHNRAAYPFPRESDIVVVNIGTNDAFAILSGEGTEERLYNGYMVFISQALSVHKNAALVLTNGFMDPDPFLGRVIDRAYETMKKQFPCRKIFRFTFPKDTGGANGHPTAAGQTEGGRQLATFLAKVLPR